MGILTRIKFAFILVWGKLELYPDNFCVLSLDGLKLLRKTRTLDMHNED